MRYLYVYRIRDLDKENFNDWKIYGYLGRCKQISGVTMKNYFILSNKLDCTSDLIYNCDYPYSRPIAFKYIGEITISDDNKGDPEAPLKINLPEFLVQFGNWMEVLKYYKEIREFFKETFVRD